MFEEEITKWHARSIKVEVDGMCYVKVVIYSDDGQFSVQVIVIMAFRGLILDVI